MEYTQMFKPWFADTPINAKKASTTLGSGDNGTITITSDLVGTEGNFYTITVLTTGASGCDMSASISGTDITVTLGKTTTVLEPTKNTAVLIATAINALAGVSATKSGTGADSITAGVTKTAFTNGQYATPVKTACFIKISNVWYITNGAVDKWTESGWYSASPTLIS